MKNKSLAVLANSTKQACGTSSFCTGVIEKIRLIAEREAGVVDIASDVSGGDMRRSVRGVLEEFQSEIIRRNIWIRIYDDHDNNLPMFDKKACRTIAEIIKNALKRHQSGKMLAYIEISFLVNETGTVVTIEDNASSISVDELHHLSFLQKHIINILPGGYTMQAVVSHRDTDAPDEGTTIGQASVRCVANCFTRFTVCFPH